MFFIYHPIIYGFTFVSEILLEKMHRKTLNNTWILLFNHVFLVKKPYLIKSISIIIVVLKDFCTFKLVKHENNR